MSINSDKSNVMTKSSIFTI